MSVSVSVSMFEDEKSESFYNLAGRLGSSNSKLFRRPFIASSVLLLLSIKLQPFFSVLGNFEELSIVN